MKNRKRRVAILSLIVGAAGVLFSILLGGRGGRARGILPSEAYIWQRSWTPAVQSAVRSSAPSFNGYVLLAAEVSFEPNIKIARVVPDAASLRTSNLPIGMALRIGPYRGKFDTSGEVTERLCELAETMVRDAAKKGVRICEFQIDFDCPQSHLDGYRTWALAIKHRIAPLPLTITALPSWLNQRDFATLARAVDGYVLQVHSLQKPGSVDDPMTLCDPLAAKRAVEQAGRIGVRFRVALPTYGYAVAFDDDGRFVGLAAEAASGIVPANGTIRYLNADPAAMASLVRAWTNDRPASLTGLIWYRLPTADDALNWRWATLQAVMSGREPVGRVTANIRRGEPGLFDLEVVNSGDADAPLPACVAVRWHGGELVAADALGGYGRSMQADGMTLKPSHGSVEDRLAPGDRRAIGWVRLNNEDKEVHADVTLLEP